MRFTISEDAKYICLDESSIKKFQLKGFKEFFKKKSKKHEFAKFKNGFDGKQRFYDKQYRLKFGLWKEVFNFGKKVNTPIEIVGIEKHLNLGFKETSLNMFCEKILDGVYTNEGDKIDPYPYQYEAVLRAIRYKKSSQELATSAGKTLIFYLYNTYLKVIGEISKDKKSLIIVPKVKLVNQTYEAFMDEYANGKVPLKIVRIGGKNKFKQEEFDECDMLIGTWQSLKNYDKEIFHKFNVICCDEVHTARGNSINFILKNAINSDWRLGLSGTIDIEPEYGLLYEIMQRVGGPLVMKLGAKYLIDKKYSPNINIKIINLLHNQNDPIIKKYGKVREESKEMYADLKDWGREMSSIEKRIVWDSERRLEFINNLVKSFNKNCLILFTDIKNEYGMRVHDSIQQWNEKTYYIDGDVKNDDRDEYQKIMEANNNVVLVASFGTFSTGINLKNVHHIIFAESIKSEIIIRQSIGRGMRRLAEKHQVYIWDLVDVVLPRVGYGVKHSVVRNKIYRSQKFSMTSHDKKL